jgi:hypothetical protein
MLRDHHIFQCTGNTKWKIEFTDNLDKFLTEIETADDIKKALSAGFKGWLNGNDTTTDQTPSRMQKLVKYQKAIGWNLAMSGLLDENWGAMQDTHFARNSDRRDHQTGKAWSSKLSEWLIWGARKKWRDRNDKMIFDKPLNEKLKEPIQSLKA